MLQPQATTSAPAWLAAAEADHAQADIDAGKSRINQANERATAINATLRGLGITPLSDARVHADYLVPALLLHPDPVNWHYGVWVGWSDISDQAALYVTDWEQPSGRWDQAAYSRLLNRAADVIDAREEGPASQPTGPDDLAQALRSLTERAGSNAVVIEAVNGVTAAVLNLVKATARASDRP